jgi:hypothetical protein
VLACHSLFAAGKHSNTGGIANELFYITAVVIIVIIINNIISTTKSEDTRKLSSTFLNYNTRCK